MCIQLCICFCRTAFIARTSSHAYLFCSSTPSGSAVPYLDWWIISALCSAVARLVQPDCTTQLQLRICIQNAHTHTFTPMSTKHAPAVPTPSILPDASLRGGCNKLLKKQTKTTKKQQQQFSITQCHLTSASGVYENCSVTRQQTEQRAKQGKNPPIPKLSPEVDFKNLNSGFMAFKFKAGKEKKRCWNVSSILKWQTCWCGDLYVLWLKGWGAAGQMSRGYKLTSEWKGRGGLALWLPVLLMPLKSHFKAGRSLIIRRCCWHRQ